ncbi:MAG: prepilin-type N-terminal cleavage/methylation domain-containing protein [Candidatus Eisenbacteria sp.]|nr:prepilin-type N-terminal cleavage/methylation domain-containing protein [Candidatus Eisenbacteria bacterium]
MSMLRNSKGFTLVELMVVVIIVLVLAGIAVPVYIHYIQEGKKSEAYAVIDSIVSGALVYFQKNDTYAGGTWDLWLAADDVGNAFYFDYGLGPVSADNAGFVVKATATGAWAGTPPGTVTWTQSGADVGAGDAGIGSFAEANW